MADLEGSELQNCPACDVTVGERHQDGCGIARCGLHGWQWIACPECCGDYDDDDDDDEPVERPAEAHPQVWTGTYPGVLECQQMGFWTTREDGKETEDLNKLASYAFQGLVKWDRKKEQWVPRSDS